MTKRKLLKKNIPTAPPVLTQKPSTLNCTLFNHPASTLIALSIIVAACLIIYLPTLKYQFTNLDDTTIIQNIQNTNPPLRYAFTRDAFLLEGGNGFYRPLQTMTFIFDCRIGSSSPAMYHGTNLIIFCIGCSLLLLLLCGLGYTLPTSLFATMVIVVHPLLTQAIAWIPARGDLLLFLFGVLTIFSLVKFEKTNRWLYGLLHIAAFTLAVLSKETGVVLPLISSFYLLIQRKKISALLSRQTVFLAISWVAVGGCYVLFRMNTIARLPGQNEFGWLPFINNVSVVPETIASFFWPFSISVLPSFTLTRTITGLVLLALVVMILKLRKTSLLSISAFGGLWFVLGLVPGMAYSFGTGGILYDYLNHRALFPIIGLLLILIECSPKKWLLKNTALGTTIAAGIIATLAVLSWNQSKCFASPMTFYYQAVRTNPKSALAFKGLGSAQQNSGDLVNAQKNYDQALAIMPDFPNALYDRSSVRIAIGDTQGAIEDLNKLVTLQPANVKALRKKAKLEYENRDFLNACKSYDAAIKYNNSDADLFNERAMTKQMVGNFHGALDDLLEADARNPGSFAIIYNIGLLKFNVKDTIGACEAWNRSSALGCTEARDMLVQYCQHPK